MKLSDFLLFTDENIDPLLVDFLRKNNFDVFDVKESALSGSSDKLLLELATKNNRVIVTLDSDFGTLIHRDNKDFIGIVFLKPGHFDALYLLQTFDTLLHTDLEVQPPFMLIAEWTTMGIKIRLKNAIIR